MFHAKPVTGKVVHVLPLSSDRDKKMAFEGRGVRLA